jgi:hypothetical protein
MRPLIALAALCAVPALAQERPAPPAQDAAAVPVPARPGQPPLTVIAEPVAMMIAGFDADGDARVTRAEFDAGLRRSFDSADTTHAGTIGYIRFSDWAERWMGDRNTLPSPFETDRDGDNQISWAELAARFDAIFARFDADKDGVLVRKELVTIRPQMQGPGGFGGKGGKDRRPRN